MLQDYERVAGPDVIEQVRQLTRPLEGAKVVHVNSTRSGGGWPRSFANWFRSCRNWGSTRTGR